MDSDKPRLAKKTSPQRKSKVDAEHDLSQVLERANLQGMIITDNKDHHERTFVKSRDPGPRMKNENGVEDLTPWTVLASQRIVMAIDEAFRKLDDKDYLNKCDYPLPGKRICTWEGGGGGHR
jgi:hypothetical protein